MTFQITTEEVSTMLTARGSAARVPTWLEAANSGSAESPRMLLEAVNMFSMQFNLGLRFLEVLECSTTQTRIWTVEQKKKL